MRLFFKKVLQHLILSRITCYGYPISYNYMNLQNWFQANIFLSARRIEKKLIANAVIFLLFRNITAPKKQTNQKLRKISLKSMPRRTRSIFFSDAPSRNKSKIFRKLENKFKENIWCCFQKPLKNFRDSYTVPLKIERFVPNSGHSEPIQQYLRTLSLEKVKYM